jgi:hypothetical protein
LLTLLIGCYAPLPRAGAPCDVTDDCPSPQRCVLGACGLRDPSLDAAPDPGPDAAVDAAIDAAPPDATRLPCTTAGLTCQGGTATAFSCGGNCWVRCTANVPRETARAACAAWQGALGQIDDATEQSCVAMRVATATWVGLIQSPTATKPNMGWTWNGATALVYTHWAPGKPDDADGIEAGGEQCASIRAAGTWDDDSCNSAVDFLCERP